MSLVEINKISHSNTAEIISCLASPEVGASIDAYAINFSGWVLSRTQMVTGVEVNGNCKIENVCLDYIRKDLTSACQNEAKLSFNFPFTLIGLPLHFEIVLSAISEDGTKLDFLTVSGCRRPVKTDFMPSMQPLMINSLGRTGTTLLMKLLSAHPKIVAQRRHPFEAHPASYWMQFFKTLTAPYSLNYVNFGAMVQNLSSIGPNPCFSSEYVMGGELRSWFGLKYIESMATFCQRSIEGYYQAVALSQQQNNPSYFAEKHLPSFIPEMLWELYPESKEIILVRDFRDMLSSILSFNLKRGTLDFGRSRVKSDAEYIAQLRGSLTLLYNAWEKRKNRTLLVRYEDLVLIPEITVQGILKYLDLDHSPEIINDMIMSASENTAEAIEHKTTYSTQSSIGRWRKDLNSVLKDACKKEFGVLLERFGYEAE